MNLVKEFGLRPEAYPDCNAVAYDKAAWLGRIAGHGFFTGKDKNRVKTTLLSIAYQCRMDEAWPQPMKDLHDQIGSVVREHSRRYPDRVSTAWAWCKSRM